MITFKGQDTMLLEISQDNAWLPCKQYSPRVPMVALKRKCFLQLLGSPNSDLNYSVDIGQQYHQHGLSTSC